VTLNFQLFVIGYLPNANSVTPTIPIISQFVARNPAEDFVQDCIRAASNAQMTVENAFSSSLTSSCLVSTLAQAFHG
jgi:hypothetical protein